MLHEYIVKEEKPLKSITNQEEESVKKFIHMYKFVLDKLSNKQASAELYTQRVGRDNSAMLQTIVEMLLEDNDNIPREFKTPIGRTLLETFTQMGYLLKTEEERYELNKSLGLNNEMG